MKRTLIVLHQFIGNGTSKVEVIEQKETYLATQTYTVMENKKVSLFIKRKNHSKLTFTVQSVNFDEFKKCLASEFNCMVLDHKVF